MTGQEARDERPLTPCGNIVCTGCRVCGCPALGIAPQEARDDEREALINDLNATVSWLKQTGDLLDADRVMRAIAALRKHPEPEITDEMVDALAKSWLSIDISLEDVDVWGGARDEWLNNVRTKARAALEAALKGN